MTDINIPDYWTPEQATVVFEFVDDIRDKILAQYHLQIVEYMKAERCYDSEALEAHEDQDIPF